MDAVVQNMMIMSFVLKSQHQPLSPAKGYPTRGDVPETAEREDIANVTALCFAGRRLALSQHVGTGT